MSNQKVELPRFACDVPEIEVAERLRLRAVNRLPIQSQPFPHRSEHIGLKLHYGAISAWPDIKEIIAAATHDLG
jgi:hypothetical protein